jgi:hypothetical protein
MLFRIPVKSSFVLSVLLVLEVAKGLDAETQYSEETWNKNISFDQKRFLNLMDEINGNYDDDEDTRYVVKVRSKSQR